MKKIKIRERTADILDMVFTFIYLALAFWVDWRIGLAFLAYDLSCVFSDIKDEMKREKSARRILEIIREEISKRKSELKQGDEEFTRKVREFMDTLPNRGFSPITGMPHGCQPETPQGAKNG